MHRQAAEVHSRQ